MPYSLGAIELLILATMAFNVAVFHMRGHRHVRLAAAVLIAAIPAALLTPADVVSMVVLLTAFLGMFALGMRMRFDRPIDVT